MVSLTIPAPDEAHRRERAMNGEPAPYYFFVMTVLAPGRYPQSGQTPNMPNRMPQEAAMKSPASMPTSMRRPAKPLEWADRSGASAPAPLPSSAEEHEPDHAQDQDCQPGRNRQQRQHRRAGLGLARLGRGFDDLAMSSLPWGLPSDLSACMPANASTPPVESNAGWGSMFRLPGRAWRPVRPNCAAGRDRPRRLTPLGDSRLHHV